MPTLPLWIMTVIDPFAQAFWGVETWYRAQEMVVGALLTTGKRTVSAVLRALGRGAEKDYAHYHAVLNRAVWSGLEVSKLLLRTVLQTFDTGGALVFGIDETIERRRGEKIAARGIYRDPVRSSKSHFVKTSGLRWISLMWLTPISWAQRIWALPILTVLAPSERYYAAQSRSAKSITRWAMQMVCQLRHWLPNRTLVIVGDSSYAALELLHHCQTLAQPVTFITRLRMDAALYAPAPVYSGKGRPRKKGARLPTPAQVANDSQTVWSRLTADWYAHAQRQVDIAVVDAVWYHTGLPRCPSATCSSAMSLVSSTHKHFSLPTPPLTHCFSSPTSSVAGRWNPPSSRCAPISALKPSVNGLTKPLRVPHPLCSDSSRWSLSWPIPSSPNMVSPVVRRPGTPNPCPPSAMPSPWFGSVFGVI